MTLALINKFDGGITEDPRARSSDQYQQCTGFDVFTNPHLLIPFGDQIDETLASGIMNDIQLDGVVVTSLGYISVGYTSSVDARPTMYTKTNFNDAWGANGTGAAGYAYVLKSLTVYHGKAYILGLNGSQYNLYRFDGGGVLTSIGTFTPTVGFSAKPYVHPKDDKLYIGFGSQIYIYDGAALTHYDLTQTSFVCSSLTNYGEYLAMTGNNNSKPQCLLWGRDTTLSTIQGIVDLGEGTVTFGENLGGILFFIMNPMVTSFSTIQNKIIIKSWAGGAVDPIKSIQVSSTNSIISYTRRSDKLYFASANDTAIYAFGKNKEGNYILTQDRYMYNGATVGSSIGGLTFIGDLMFIKIVDLSGTYHFMRSKTNGLGESITYNSIALYKTLINHGMGLSRYTIQDVHKLKTVDAMGIQLSASTTGTTELGYAMDGSSFTDVINQANSTITRNILESTKQTDGQPLNDGREFELLLSSSGGTSIRQILYRYSPENSQL